MIRHCPCCASPVVPAFGDSDSEILFIGGEPSDGELETLRPFSDSTAAIFRKELFKHAKVDLSSVRQVLLWYHAPSKNKDCFTVSLDMVMKEMHNKKFIVLIGADAVSHFTGLSIDNVNGLDVTECIDVENKDVKFFAISTPTLLFRSLGEFRFGLSQLGVWLQENNYAG